ncbi:hypothetical protein [Labrenzia sp. PHM005]|uniref:hypothetical protein n=1 Tax=Labrenzia sp. PHM005 TaxID=2590016 RepID=UPI00113FCB14|nr:hypothetical protein [Labrenzia sp. PHM005]QDG74398.1 hypothetical protein FJ695_00090 [Labrenzia sp. PHM005]
MDLGDLDDFQPKPKPTQPAVDTKRAVDSVSSFPSREAPEEGQMNIKGNKAILMRFKQMCKDDRRSYADMLEILMDRFEKP